MSQVTYIRFGMCGGDSSMNGLKLAESLDMDSD